MTHFMHCAGWAFFVQFVLPDDGLAKGKCSIEYREVNSNT